MPRIKHERIKLKEKDYGPAQWQTCIAGPSEVTDVGTLCGKTAWPIDFDIEEVPDTAEVTCDNCLYFLKWMNQRKF